VGYDSVQNQQRVDTKDLMKYIVPQDLKSFGLIPEIIGRLPVLTYLDPLGRDALRRILTEPKNSLVKQQIKLFAMDGIKLSYEEEALDYIVDKAVEYKLGARGLRSIMESIMIEAQYSAPSEAKDTLVITRQYAEEQLEKQKEKLSNVG
jgi:ATP-dependent Clp protease ATP-binding subunit ClpX